MRCSANESSVFRQTLGGVNPLRCRRSRDFPPETQTLACARARDRSQPINPGTKPLVELSGQQWTRGRASSPWQSYRNDISAKTQRRCIPRRSRAQRCNYQNLPPSQGYACPPLNRYRRGNLQPHYNIHPNGGCKPWPRTAIVKNKTDTVTAMRQAFWPALVILLSGAPSIVAAQYKVEILSSQDAGTYTDVKAKIPWDEGYDATLDLRVYCRSGNVYSRDYQGKWTPSHFASVNAFIITSTCK